MKRRAYTANDDVKAIHNMHETACCMQKARAHAPDQLQRQAVLDQHDREDLVQPLHP